jgi:hypothetical protein
MLSEGFLGKRIYDDHSVLAILLVKLVDPCMGNDVYFCIYKCKHWMNGHLLLLSGTFLSLNHIVYIQGQVGLSILCNGD